MRRLTVLALFAVPMLASAAGAATISWGPATTIVGDSDVSTLQTPVYAYRFASDTANTSAVVNGVTFNAFQIPFNSGPLTQGNVSVRETNGPSWGLGFGQGFAAPYTSLSAGYQTLLSEFASSGVQEAIEVTMGGLTVGQTYQVQAWSNTSRDGATLVTSLDGTRLLDANTTDLEGGLGQYAIGTFVADATSQIFTNSAVEGRIVGPFGTIPALNAFQLRAVPEPTSMLVLGAAGAMLARRRR